MFDEVRFSLPLFSFETEIDVRNDDRSPNNTFSRPLILSPRHLNPLPIHIINPNDFLDDDGDDGTCVTRFDERTWCEGSTRVEVESVDEGWDGEWEGEREC